MKTVRKRRSAMTEVIDHIDNYVRDEQVLTGRHVTQGELVEVFGLNKATVKQIVRSLEASGKVTLWRDEVRLAKGRVPSWIA